MSKTTFLKRHPKLALIFFNLILLFVVFVIFEIALRIFTPDWLQYRMEFLSTGNGYGYGTDATWKVNYRNGEYYSFMPDSSFKIYHPEYENTVDINNLGGRASFHGEKADTANIIPFTGDSFVMGVGVEDSQTMVSNLRKKLHFNFLNLGVGGSSLPIQRRIIEMRYDELGKPPVAIFGFFLGNDFDDILKIALDRMDTSKKVVDSAKVNKTGFWWKVNNFINHNFFLKKLYVLQFIKQKVMAFRKRGNDAVDQIFLISNAKNADYISRAKSEVDKEVGLLVKQPYKPIFILIPDRYQVNTVIRRQMCEYYNIDYEDFKPRLANDVIISILDKYHIEYIDGTQCIANHLKDGKLYYTKDNHFTPLGNRIFSECIADSLQKKISRYTAHP